MERGGGNIKEKMKRGLNLKFLEMYLLILNKFKHEIFFLAKASHSLSKPFRNGYGVLQPNVLKVECPECQGS
jgi:hypothetical protein